MTRSSSPEMEFINLLHAEGPLREAAAKLLMRAFAPTGTAEWRNMVSCRTEVDECTVAAYLCFGILLDGTLAGWIGFRPMYRDYTWELHPLAVDPAFEGRGAGRALVTEGERRLAARGVRGIVLGSDDESGGTSLSGRDLTQGDLFDEIRSIRNLNRHPYEFYCRLGYRIVGVIPDASGSGKPDILMWKRLEGPEQSI